MTCSYIRCVLVGIKSDAITRRVGEYGKVPFPFCLDFCLGNGYSATLFQYLPDCPVNIFTMKVN